MYNAYRSIAVYDLPEPFGPMKTVKGFISTLPLTRGPKPSNSSLILPLLIVLAAFTATA
ncbi:MAG: hypothetical protein QXT56_02355 [Candidatus Nitrosocaldus sp.]